MMNQMRASTVLLVAAVMAVSVQGDAIRTQGNLIAFRQMVSTIENKLTATVMADPLRQFDCVKDVPKDTDWLDTETCPQKNNGDCCIEKKTKSQVVGFLLQFFLGGFGSGYWYYGDYVTGGCFVGAMVFICCCGPLVMMALGINAMDPTKAVQTGGSSGAVAGCFILVNCGFCCLVLASWIMMITKDTLPFDECPLNCNL